MHALSPVELLEVWENGLTQTADQKALTLLRAAFPEEPLAKLAQRSIGQRNALLLTLRERLFGPQFTGVARCPRCGERLEVNFKTEDIRAAPAAEPVETLTLQASGYEVLFRLPNSIDLADVGGHQDAAVVEQMLLERCLLSVRHLGEETPIGTLPPNIVEAVVDRMEQADPQANIQLSLMCSACGHQWRAIFDILPYLWRELNAWARRILREVHYIASAYGWHEHDILHMRPWRRQLYMEMIGR